MTTAKKLFALVALIAIVVPATFFITPKHARAVPVEITVDGSIQSLAIMHATETSALQNTISAIKNSISAIADITSSINDTALYVKAYVLDPLAFVLSGNALKAITAGVIDFVNGGNGRGPMFVQDLRAHLLNTGDTQALAFFAEFGNSNSPFAGNILSSLRANYLQGTSAAGYWGANRCTLDQYSPNPLGFVGGDFSQGGWSAWFALTSQPQNNPYAQYYRAQAELASRVRGATAEALSELAWGDGFLSWCGEASEEEVAAEIPESVEITPDIDNATIPASVDITSAFGTPGNCGPGKKTQTPASVIRDGLQKVLGTDIDKLINVGDASTIFQNIASTLQVMSYGANLLGAGGSGGLFGISHPSGATPTSLLNQYRSNPYFGITQAGINQNATLIRQNATNQAIAQGTAGVAAVTATLPSSSGTGGVGSGGGTGSGTTPYTIAWQTIGAAANDALTELSKAAPLCSSYRVFATNITNATAVVTAVSQKAVAANFATPTASDTTQAQFDAQTTSGATTPSCGALTSTGGTLVDQMKLISSTAKILQYSCTLPITQALTSCPP